MLPLIRKRRYLHKYMASNGAGDQIVSTPIQLECAVCILVTI